MRQVRLMYGEMCDLCTKVMNSSSPNFHAARRCTMYDMLHLDGGTVHGFRFVGKRSARFFLGCRHFFLSKGLTRRSRWIESWVDRVALSARRLETVWWMSRREFLQYLKFLMHSWRNFSLSNKYFHWERYKTLLTALQLYLYEIFRRTIEIHNISTKQTGIYLLRPILFLNIRSWTKINNQIVLV